MTMNFQNAEGQKDFTTLIPQGTLALGVLKLRPYNADAGIVETPGKKNPDNKYLNCEIILEGGEYNKRHVFTRIGVAGSDAYVNMGRSSIRAILEHGRGASDANPQGYNLNSYAELDGLQVAIKIKEEEQDGFAPRNDVAVFLSPIQPGTEKDWKRLQAGDTKPQGKQAIRKSSGGGGQGATAPQPARWASGAQPAAAPQQAAPATAAPAPAAPAQPAEAPAGETVQQPASPPAGGGTPAWLQNAQQQG